MQPGHSGTGRRKARYAQQKRASEGPDLKKATTGPLAQTSYTPPPPKAKAKPRVVKVRAHTRRIPPRPEPRLEAAAPPSSYHGKPVSQGEVVAAQLERNLGIRAAGLPRLGDVPGVPLAARAVSQVGQGFLYSPYGLYRAATTDPRTTLAELGRGFQADIQHPGRNPGFLALDIGSALSAGGTGAARGAAALSRLGEEGTLAARLGGAGRALARSPEPGTRSLRFGELEANAPASRNPTARALMRGKDTALQRAAAKNPGGRAERRLTTKMGKWLAAERRVTDALAKGDAAALGKVGKQLSLPQQVALRVVAEGVPIEDRIAFELEHGHRRQVKLLGLAKQYVSEGEPKLTHPGLQAVYARVVKASKNREDVLQNAGVLSPEATETRLAAPAEIITGTYGIPGEARIPYARRRGSRSLGKPPASGQAGTVGYPSAPGSLTHQFTGGLLKSGKYRQDVTRLVAESNLEAQRYASVLRIRDQLKKAAVEQPPKGKTGDYIPVRLDKIKSKPLPILQDVLQKAEEGGKLTAAEKQQLGTAYQRFVDDVFPDPGTLTADEIEGLKGKIGWVPRGLLENVDRPILVPGRSLRTFTNVVDSINNAFRLAVLYLKPAYAAPNILGNAGMNLVQQGFAAPANLARAARVNAKLGPDAAQRLDAAMGEGFALALEPQGGLGRAAIQKIANFWSAGVDRPFRRSAFLHEARRAGYKTNEQIQALLLEPAHEKKLVEVVQRANREIIDYGNLSPTERNIVRRVILFYPWVKGSTQYAGRLLVEHPGKATALAQTGREAKKHAPKVPSYLEGSFRAHGGLVNPSSAAILGTPAQVSQAGLALLGLAPTVQASKAANFLSPALSLGVAAATHTDPTRGTAYPATVTPGEIAQEQLFNNLPQVRLAQRIGQANDQRSYARRLFPPDTKSAVEQFLIGGIAPRPYNPSQLSKQAEDEYLSTLDAGKRTHYRALKEERDFLGRIKKANPRISTEALARVRAILRTKTLYKIAERKVKEDLGMSSQVALTERQQIEIKVDVLAGVNRRAATHRDDLLKVISGLRDGTREMADANRAIEKALGWDVLAGISGVLNARKRAEREKAVAHG